MSHIANRFVGFGIGSNFEVQFSEKLTSLASEAGFSVNTCEYVHRKTVNKKEGLCVPRIFVQAKFVKQINHVYSDRKSQLDSCFENVKLDIGEDGVS